MFLNLINSINELNYESKDIKKALIQNVNIPQYLREHLTVVLINSNDYYDDYGKRFNIDDSILDSLYWKYYRKCKRRSKSKSSKSNKV